MDVISGCPRLPSLLEGVSVLEGHEVVEDGVDGGRDVVQDAGHVHQVLVYRSKELGALKRIRAFCSDALRKAIDELSSR